MTRRPPTSRVRVSLTADEAAATITGLIKIVRPLGLPCRRRESCGSVDRQLVVLAGDLVRRFGRFKTMGWAIDTWSIQSGTLPEEGFLEDVAATVAKILGVEMKMDGNVMRMRALPRIDLPARQTVKLAPGGAHLMLLDLKQPVKILGNGELKKKLTVRVHAISATARGRY